MIAQLNDTAYAQRALLDEDWEMYEIIPKEPIRPQGPPVDGSIPDRLPSSRRGPRFPYWMLYPAGPEPYQAQPDTDPVDVWYGRTS